MKQKISISIDSEKIKLVEQLLCDGKFRNKSHVLEYSLEKFLKEVNGGLN
jgi:Arc/MetJ-type ribon-helix-helix transcriptional regulator